MGNLRLRTRKLQALGRLDEVFWSLLRVGEGVTNAPRPGLASVLSQLSLLKTSGSTLLENGNTFPHWFQHPDRCSQKSLLVSGIDAAIKGSYFARPLQQCTVVCVTSAPFRAFISFTGLQGFYGSGCHKSALAYHIAQTRAIKGFLL